MEAKRQRRREGREAGRRRAPILSEAEFLARRESVVRKMVVRQRDELSQIAVLENDILVEHYVDRESAASLIGNVYLGRVQNVLPSMEAAFIDIGRGRNAVLYAGEVDWDAFGANGQQRKVENVLKSGQSVLVQVTKDPVGAKGARLTSHVTLPGRYIVYAPGGHLSGISRKLPDNERKRLKSVLSDLVPESASVIVRTAAEGASEDELVRDVNRLKAQWEDIERKVKAGSAPKLMYGEPDLTVRIVRDLFTEDFAELIIQGNGSGTDSYEAVDAYVEHVAPHLHERLSRWDAEADGDLFAKYRLDEQISKALERKVFLPSGGSLIIDRTEAMTVIDVNTGKFTGSGGNLEATVTSNNLEAAEEIVRQLRLRDIGGIIVIDFIDMVLPSNRELLLRRLVECLGRDRTRHQVAEVTSLGLVQMTRKKIGTGLLEAFTTECEVCHGRGYEISDVPVETQKQPDGGSRDHRGGGNGGGGGRGRGRGDRSSNGNAKPPVPSPPAPRAEEGSGGSEGHTEPSPAEQTADEPATAG
jgi:ribonuclease E